MTKVKLVLLFREHVAADGIENNPELALKLMILCGKGPQSMQDGTIDPILSCLNGFAVSLGICEGKP
jgi:hypothetical protein